jgi:hypothetical protein
VPILPGLKASAINCIEVLPQKREREIRACRTNQSWQLVAPLVYPAQAISIEGLLATLEHLAPVAVVGEQELKNRASADEEYGFTAPQYSMILQPGNYRIRIGRKTSPGDQVFVQIGDTEGIFVVDADLLKLIPQTADDWRDTTFLNLAGQVVDRIAVTNGATIFTLLRDRSNSLWRVVFPITARANQQKIEDSLRQLQSLRINQFASDDPQPDLERFGLQPAKVETSLSAGTNPAVLLQFGASPTNNPNTVYARRLDRSNIVTVAQDLLSSWQTSTRDFRNFRDPHLLEMTRPIDTIDVQGQDSFQLQRLTNQAWIIVSNNLPVDATLVNELVSGLAGLEVAEFVKDFVTDPDLPTYGLATPTRRYVLKTSAESLPPGTTNAVIGELLFGTNQESKVYARRSDESSVYGINPADFQRLPSAGWQLRNRQIWNTNENEVARVTIRQHGKVREIVNKLNHNWSLAPGSQGSIEDLAVDQTVRGLCHLAAVAWAGHGEQNLARYGFAPDGHKITLDLKSGEKLTVEFGGEAPPASHYAAVNLDGEAWIFEFPVKLYRDVLAYLTIP